MEQSLFVKYGSRLTSGMAECVYDRVLADDELAPFFKGIDIEVLREHMADFLTVLTGGPNIYKGRDIYEAHKDFTITAAHFDAVARLCLRERRREVRRLAVLAAGHEEAAVAAIEAAASEADVAGGERRLRRDRDAEPVDCTRNRLTKTITQ